MTAHYDFDENGLLKKVRAGSRKTVGLKYLSEARVIELSEGKYKGDGWLLSDSVHSPMHYGRDDLGIQGVLNPADGKRYDSKAEYYRAVKDKGLVVVGDDAPKERAEPKLKKIDWHEAVAETLRKTPKKGRKK